MPSPVALLFVFGSFLGSGLGSSPSRPRDEFGERLAQLSSPRAAERAAAERWLEAHLALERYPEIAEAALAGDAEVRGRLVHVLASDARHLSLALELCSEADAGLSALGREAVRAAVVRHDPRLGEPGVRARGLEELRRTEELLRGAAAPGFPRLWTLDPSRPLEELCAELELVAELPLGLCVDPRVATRTIRREEELERAPWNELVLRLARGVNVAVECHGLAGDGGDGAPGSFVYLTVEGEPARTAAERITEWLLVLATEPSAATRERAARCLGSSGFAPAIEWMGEDFERSGDSAAREGVLRAAALGRVAAVLTSAQTFDALLAEAEQRGGPRSASILCALARAGCVARDGAPLAARLFDGFAALGPRARWSRLFVLERNRCVSAEGEAPARALLADPSTPAALRLRALFFLAANTGASAREGTRVEDLPALFRLGLDGAEVERMARALALFGVAPPFRDPAEIPLDWKPRERLDLLQAWMWSAEARVVPAHVSAWLGPPGDALAARGEALADELHPWIARGARGRLERALEGAGELAAKQEPALARVRLLLGLVPPAEVAALVARHGWVVKGPGADLALLGALAGYPLSLDAARAARERLFAELAAAMAESRAPEAARPLVRALERAAHGVLAAGGGDEAAAFLRAVAQATGRAKNELAERLASPSWPASPHADSRDAARELARFEVPPL